MNFHLVKYEMSCGLAGQLPESTLPEVVFAGRSNVGKSSLINALARRRALAKVSATPGKTRSVNYYRVSPYDFCLVDLPGYGYAARSKDQRAKLKELIENYVLHRREMTLLFVLIDVRHAPQKIDMEFMSFLGENGVPFAIIFTKADKLGVTVLRDKIEAYKTRLLEDWEELVETEDTGDD